jgi:hypothetical protein
MTKPNRSNTSLLGARHSVAHLCIEQHMSATEWRAPSNDSIPNDRYVLYPQIRRIVRM